ncbi:MAG: hypothetical protein AAGK22_21820 [Acidobacteriota bacterium]
MNWLYFRDYVFEDAYITFRHARNLANGNGFVFNPSERLLGTSTPLYTLVLSVCGVLGLSIAPAASFLYAAFLSASAWLAARLVSPKVTTLSLGVALLVLAGHASSRAFWGMESTMYLALILATFLALEREREGTAALYCGLACLTRYDGFLLAALIVLLETVRQRRIPSRFLLVVIAVVTPWLVFGVLYFGGALPNTLSAKRDDVATLDYLAGSAAEQLENANVLNYLFQAPGSSAPIVTALMALLLFSPILRASPKRLLGRLTTVYMLVFSLGLWISYAIIGAPLGQPWHLYPASIVLLVCSSLLITPAVRESVSLLSLLSMTAVWLPLFLWSGATQRDALLHGPSYRGRIGAYDEMVEWLQRKQLAGLSLMTYEPGYLGYQLDNRVVDLAGLVSEGFRYHGPSSDRSDALAAARELRPSLVVGHPGHLPGRSWPGYVAAFHAFPGRVLQMDRSVWKERFPDLLEQWLSQTVQPEVGKDLRIPTLGVEASRQQPEGRPTAFATSTSPSPWQGLRTSEFLIDFDEISFTWSASHPQRTQALLISDGQILLSTFGSPRGDAIEVVWFVGAWRGRRASLHFVDMAPEGHRLLVSDLRSREHVDPKRLELDTGITPRASAELAREKGLALSSLSDLLVLNVGDGASIRSGDFPIESEAISFLVLDYCGEGCRVELVAKGRVRRSLESSSSSGLRSVLWGTRNLRGQSAHFVIRRPEGSLGPFGVAEAVGHDL